MLANAQNGNETIEYGQTVTGEITNRNFEIPFDFTGSEGDVIIIEMSPVDDLGDLNSPQIILLNEDGDVVGDTSGSFSFGSTLFTTQLENDGTYTILATRSDGRAGDSVGEFTLALINPERLEANSPLEGSISSSGGSNYYLVEVEGSDIAFKYSKTDGEFAPDISVNVINDYYGLDSIITLNGDALSDAQVALPSRPNLFIVKVSEALFDFNFETVSADYEVTVIINE
ncbi:MAG: hypothetical protein IT321_29290 [Anaerolineae bacterium]|nr:hypothetical protein [Anaerolineae bacterium]